MITAIEQPFTEAEKQRASTLKVEIERLVSAINEHEKSLSSDWVRLGRNLFEVRESKLWILWEYESFGSYIVEVGNRVNKGRSQLYQSIGVVEKLPSVSDADLTKMGISKASELGKLAKYGKGVPEELIAKAVDEKTSINDVKEEVFKELHAEADAPGRFFDVGGFYVTPEEKQEIERTFNLARRVDPVIQNNIPEWAQRKEIVLRLVKEFWSTYGTQ